MPTAISATTHSSRAAPRVGNGVTVKNGVLVFSGVFVEDDVLVGPGVVFTNDLTPRAAKKGVEDLMATMVGTGATLGARAVVVCGTPSGSTLRCRGRRRYPGCRALRLRRRQPGPPARVALPVRPSPPRRAGVPMRANVRLGIGRAPGSGPIRCRRRHAGLTRLCWSTRTPASTRGSPELCRVGFIRLASGSGPGPR